MWHIIRTTFLKSLGSSASVSKVGWFFFSTRGFDTFTSHYIKWVFQQKSLDASLSDAPAERRRLILCLCALKWDCSSVMDSVKNSSVSTWLLQTWKCCVKCLKNPIKGFTVDNWFPFPPEDASVLPSAVPQFGGFGKIWWVIYISTISCGTSGKKKYSFT